jgi:coatomer subunit beta'
MKIFEKSLNDASIKEKYVNQVKQMIDIALKCMDHDRAKRPSSSEILQIFNLNPAERSSSELNSKCEQVLSRHAASSHQTLLHRSERVEEHA